MSQNNTPSQGFSPEEQIVILEGLQQEFETFTGSFMPLLPDRVAFGLYLDNMNDFVDLCNRFTPVSSYVNEKARTKLQGLLNPPESFSDLFETADYVPTSANEYFLAHTDSDGKATHTLKGLNTSIGYFEIAVLTFKIN